MLLNFGAASGARLFALLPFDVVLLTSTAVLLAPRAAVEPGVVKREQCICVVSALGAGVVKPPIRAVVELRSVEQEI